MSTAELDILRFFRRYEIRASEMLFFNPADCKIGPDFQGAMNTLMKKGLVLKERPQHAYCLTDAGFKASISLGQSA